MGDDSKYSLLFRLATNMFGKLQNNLVAIVYLWGLFSVSASFASAQCPAVGLDTGCGTIITITDTGASITYTGQGPYDGIDDTLVGVINNSRLPVKDFIISSPSGLPVFGFDGDGICGLSPNPPFLPYVPAPPACPYGPTGYEGPGVSFSNISADQTTGTVNFITPISANGGTAYFSLENVLSGVTACSTAINNSVTQALTQSGTAMTASFIPNNGLTLDEAAALCGFTLWDWQQTITSLPFPSPYFDAKTGQNLYTTPNPPAPNPPGAPFNDPPPGDYSNTPDPLSGVLPVHYGSDEIGAETFTSTLNFFDSPADPCLPGGSGGGCHGKTAPAGSVFGATTHLVGIVGPLASGSTVVDTGIGFTWTDSFNGLSVNGTPQTSSSVGVNLSSGTGGATVTNVNEITSYQFPKNLIVTAVNGNPVSSPPLKLLTANEVSVTSSGLAYSRASKTFNGTLTITNIGSTAIPGPLQAVLNLLTTGVTLMNATNTFGGFPYVTVLNVNSLAPGQSATVKVQFSNPSDGTFNFVPQIYSGSFN
jgi:hypothetical protein